MPMQSRSFVRQATPWAVVAAVLLAATFARYGNLNPCRWYAVELRSAQMFRTTPARTQDQAALLRQLTGLFDAPDISAMNVPQCFGNWFGGLWSR